MITGPDQKPPPHPVYGDYSHRGKDPWHIDSFPLEHKDAAPVQTGERAEGWYLTDAWGNEIGFVRDGTEF
jgi:hypothetical protein